MAIELQRRPFTIDQIAFVPFPDEPLSVDEILGPEG
jgi:hypothetical protein